MSPSEMKVVVEAVRWWKNRKPVFFTEEEHLENPKINCMTETEKRLAESVARLLKSK